jgi:tRNA(Ile)-lysidine synthase
LRLHVAHLNHGLRGIDADEDARHVETMCRSLAISCHVDRRDIRALAGESGRGIEETARRERYAMFHRVCLKTGSRIIALAHHADDNAETILHRVLRGTGIRGLYGIPRARPLHPGGDICIVRPLLRRTRVELRRFLAEVAVSFREDLTNSGVEPTRNWIRNELMPHLSNRANPRIVDALNRLGEQAGWLRDHLDDVVIRAFDAIVLSRSGQSLTLHVEALARKSRFVQSELIRHACRLLGLGERQLSQARIVAALELLQAHEGTKEVHWPCGVIVRRQYHELTINVVPEVETPPLVDTVIDVPGRTIIEPFRLEIVTAIAAFDPLDMKALVSESSWTESVDADRVEIPLTIRGRKPGDSFVPLGASGTRTLSDFLIDEKVPANMRNRVPVLCDRIGPIWIVGHRIADRVKITGETRRMIRVTARSLAQ